MTTQVIYSKEFLKHDDPSHPENARRLEVILETIKRNSFEQYFTMIEPHPIDEETLAKVHSREMIAAVKKISERGGGWLDLDTYTTEESYDVARLAVGGVLQAAHNVIQDETDNAYALVRPPGHHAGPFRSTGFCLFNNEAIAANEIAGQGKKVLIFDHDIHHGDGTQQIFNDRKDIMYQSAHLHPHYPGTGAIHEIGEGDGSGYTINAPLQHGMGDKALTELLDEVFIPIAQQFKPDLVIFSAGYDSHHSDSLGGLQMTASVFGEAIRRFQQVQPKIVCSLEGGYTPAWLGKCVLSQLAALTHQEYNVVDDANEKGDVKPLINKIKSTLSSYWKL